MDTKLDVSIPLVDLTVPDGTVVNHYLAVLSDGQTALIDPTAGPLSASFTVSADGDYTVTASAIGTDGKTIGTPTVSNTVTVKNAPATITVQIPDVPVLSIAPTMIPAP